MRHRRTLTAILLVGAAIVGLTGSVAAQESCGVDPPADFAEPSDPDATIGFVDGYWYTEPIAGLDSGPTTDEEMRALIARTAARVEVIRCVNIEDPPPVRTVNRTALDADLTSLYADVSPAERRFDNAKLETLMLVPSTSDSVEQRTANQGTAVQGYYDIQADRIVIVEDNATTVPIAGATLAHELVHYYQDQRYNLARYDAVQMDAGTAQRGLIEGEAMLTENAYEHRCAGTWDCVASAPSDRTTVTNRGLFAITLEPYLDGPEFVRTLENHDQLSAAYEQPPTTARHVIHPEAYPTFEPQSPPIADRSTAQWQPLRVPDRPDHGVLGPVGVAASLMTPQFDNKTTEVGIPPYAYSHPIVDAWRGDRLRVYTTATNQTAAVWKSRWADAEAAEEYANVYAAVLEFYGATPVDEPVFRFDGTTGYTGSVRVTQTNTTVTIVKAPSADALDAVHASNRSVQQTAKTPGFGALGAIVALCWAVWSRVRTQP